MGNNRDFKDMIKRALAIVLSALLFVSGISQFGYALDEESEAVIDKSTLVEAQELQAASEDTLEDSNTLLEGYMDSRLKAELSGKKRKAAEAKRRETLTDNEKIIYDGIKAFIDSVASGNEAKAVTSINLEEIFRPHFIQLEDYNVITSASLGISSGVLVKKTVNGHSYWTFSEEAESKLYRFDAVYNALLADEPYALYWFDKTEGVYYGVSGLMYNGTGNSSDIYFSPSSSPALNLSFVVSADYRAARGGETAVDRTKTSATSQAVTNAAKIITDNASLTDLEKLTSYKERICLLTSYNYDAVYNDHPYGDPWQMIYVFDDDKTNQVTCEGYSKAFQYLCDHSEFRTDIECDSVTGVSSDDSGSGLHMWNILHMDDGSNYMADITNSDQGAIGERGGLFISPAVTGGSVSSGYKYDVDSNGTPDLTYKYDNDTRSTFSEGELTMSSDEYATSHIIPDAYYEWAEDGSACVATGTCTDCGETFTEEAAITSSVKIRATCIEAGTTRYIAKFGNRGFKTQSLDIENIPMNGNHLWGNGVVTKAAAEGVEGVKEFTCIRCGKKHNESIAAIVYPTDLPAVKISKPKAGKKKMTVKWKKVSKKNQKKISGIQIQVATDTGFTNIIASTTAGKKKTSKAIKGLQSKTKYYVRIRAYAAGNHVSVWKSKSVKVK